MHCSVTPWPMVILSLAGISTARAVVLPTYSIDMDSQDLSLDDVASPADTASAAAATTSTAAPAETSSSTFIAAFGAQGNLSYPLTLGISIGAGILVLLALIGLLIFFLRRRRTRAYKSGLPRGREPPVTETNGWSHGLMVEAPTKPSRGYVRLGEGEVVRFDEPEIWQPAENVQQQPDDAPSSDGRRGRASSFVERFDVQAEVEEAPGHAEAKVPGSAATRSGDGLLIPEPPVASFTNR